MDELPPIGAHLVTPRAWYSHHGIHIGEGRVVHYAGLYRSLRGGTVEIVTLEYFARGRGYTIKSNRQRRFPAAQVVRRALSRVGENSYHLLRNNCEHFCEWCIAGRSFSAQVEAWLDAPFAMLVALWRTGRPANALVRATQAR
jgi:HRAS-like suppressor 3